LWRTCDVTGASSTTSLPASSSGVFWVTSREASDAQNRHAAEQRRDHSNLENGTLRAADCRCAVQAKVNPPICPRQAAEALCIGQFAVVGKHTKPGVSRPPSFHFLQHCRKLLWIDTVGLHHCLGNRVGQDVLERWFAMPPIQKHSLPGRAA